MSPTQLYFIIAGPMEMPYLGIQQSDPAKRQFVYCISHSRWNDGFAFKYKFTFIKRSVIEQDVYWVQILGMPVGRGDEIRVDIQGASAEAGKLDYVQFDYQSKAVGVSASE